MKRLLLPVFSLFAAGALLAADPAPDFSQFKTADALWKQIETLQEQPKVQPKSRDEALQVMGKWLGDQKAAADAFSQKYPEDPRRWQAKMLSLRASGQLRRFAGQVVVLDEDRKALAEIINAPDAPAAIKGEAAFMGVMMYTAAFDKDKPETFTAFHKAAGEFLEKYPEHPLAGQLKSIQLRVLDMDPTPEGTELLKKFASGSDPRLAETAKGQLERRQKWRTSRPSRSI